MVLADRLVVVRDDVRTTQVPRRALLRRLSRSDATVVVVQGPAGAGKTTLLRQWADADARSQVTVALSARHDSPGVLAESLVATLSAVGPDEPDAAAVVTDDEPAFSSVVVPGMAELAGSREQPYVLVLDDVHLLSDRRSHALLRSLADGVPPGSVLVLAGRAATPAWTARLRAADQLLLVGPEALAFGDDEALALVEGYGLPPAAAADLLRETDGWAVALHLAALARSADRSVGGAGSGDVGISDFLRSEVLDRLPEAQRDLLVRSSIVEAPPAELCDAIVDRDDSAVLLRDVVRRTSLVAERDGVFRAHHLLLEALRAERAESLTAGQTAELHRRAGRWFLAHGDPEAAVDHALRGDDLDTVATAVGQAVPESVGSGRSDRLARLLALVGDDRTAADPWLSLAAAWSCLQRGDIVGRDRWTMQAEEHAGRAWRQNVRTDPYAASLAALLALVGRDGVAATAQLCEDALEGLGPADPFRCPAYFLLGVCRILRDEPGGEEALEASRRCARSLGVPITEADALAFSGLLALWNDDNRTAIELIDEGARVVAGMHGDRLATAAHPYTAYAVSLALQGRRAEASRALAQARRLTEQLSGLVPWFQVLGRLVQARTALLLGDIGLAAQLTTEARAASDADLLSTTIGEGLEEIEEMVREQSTSGVGVGTLTPAELRVLAYLPSHLTFPQIGERLFLSASTVKTHALSIYRKLGVGSRAAAVEKARSLGLVEAGLRG
ncbi:MAG: AAA family ATPase [Candidatus Nanopelagicales bacterium]